ncbi:MAG: PepSY domain-containing protein [Sphingomonadaceae bacterium]|nr:PepSY domain-containing protein [Sphingomonadaceae bacterium]
MTRTTLRRVHLWMALVLGLPLAVVSATGLPVTYWWASDALFAPAYYAGSRPDAPRATFDALAAAAQVAVPAGRLTRVYLLPDYGTAQAALTVPGDTEREVSLELATAQPLGQRLLKDATISWLYSVHTRLGLDRLGHDDLGRVAVMALAAAFVALVATGLWLWWPAQVSWRTFAPTLRRHRAWLDLHNKAGLYALVPLSLAAGTALLLETPGLRGLGGHPPPPMPGSAGPAARGASLETIARAAAAATPGRPALGVFDLDQPSRVVVASGTESSGYRWIVVDRRSAAIELVSDDRPISGSPSPDPSFLIALHQGHRWGAIGQAVFAAASVVPVLLYITGLVLLVSRKRRGR